MAKTVLKVIEGGGSDPGSEQGGEPAAIEDPIVEECLADALGLFPGLLTADEIAEHRQFLAVFLTTHPAARPIYERLREGRRKRVPPANSGDVAKDGVLIGDERTGTGRGSQ